MTMSVDQAGSSLTARGAERDLIRTKLQALYDKVGMKLLTGASLTRDREAGRAGSLAHESGNGDTPRLVARVVDVVDAATGTVRLKSKVTDADEMTLDTRSSKTVRVKK